MKTMKKFKVYTHSKQNGVFQIGKTVYQIQGLSIESWNATMKDCRKENCSTIIANSAFEAIKKIAKVMI